MVAAAHDAWSHGYDKRTGLFTLDGGGMGAVVDDDGEGNGRETGGKRDLVPPDDATDAWLRKPYVGIEFRALERTGLQRATFSTDALSEVIGEVRHGCDASSDEVVRR